jgi:hypothetical protein
MTKYRKIGLIYNRDRNSHILNAEIHESFEDFGDLVEGRISAYEGLIDLIREQIRKIGEE